MTVTQSQFRAAVFDPALPTPQGLTDPQGRPAGKRFDVYRNTVMVSLTEALKSTFPVMLKLVGDAFFTELAGVFARQYPPSTPLLMFYGAEMPAFLTAFPQVAHLPYLPDIARLELGLRRSYHAADATPIDPVALTALPAKTLGSVKLQLSPATILIGSGWPIHAIWRMNTEAGAPKPLMQPEDILILRPVFDPSPHLLGPGAAAFIAALQTGQTLDQAAEAGAATLGFDIAATLGLLGQGRAVAAIKTP